MASKWIGGVVALVTTLGLPQTGFVSDASAQVSSQVSEIEPQHMLVTDQRAMIRCGAGTAYYPVAELRAGTILVMDGETSSGWARVAYPKSAAALVRTEYAQISGDGKSLTLSRDDSLVAYNALAGARGSWSKLLSTPAPRGTQFTVIGEAVNDLSGELAGYRVEAPEDARGYVRLSFLRAATPSEVEAWKNQGDAPAVAQNNDDSQTDEPAVDPGAVVTPEEDVEVATNDEQPAVDPGQDDSLVEPMIDEDVAANNPTTQPAQSTPANTAPTTVPTNTAPTTPNPTSGTDVATPTSTNTQPEAEKPAPLRISSIEELEQLFAAVQKQTTEEAEYGPLLAEVTRMYEATPETPENAGLRTALRQRQSVLKIRQRVQEATRANASLGERASEREQELVNKVRELEIQRSYAVVGRLLPSAVYDGRRLPRMYRVQSLGVTEAPRTMGYLRPSDDINLENMLGETIGVVGTPELDPRLNLLIIEPLKIDLIQAGSGQQ